MEMATVDGDSPVSETSELCNNYTPKYRGAREILRESAQTIG